MRLPARLGQTVGVFASGSRLLVLDLDAGELEHEVGFKSCLFLLDISSMRPSLKA